MIIESPTNTRVQAEVDRTYHAVRTSLHPPEWNGAAYRGGHFRRAFGTNLVTGVAANGTLVGMQFNTAEQKVFRLWEVIVDAVLTTAFGTAQEVSVNLAKTITATPTADSGQLDVRAPALQGRLRSDIVGSVITSLRVSDTAAVTDGSGTVESQHAIATLNLGNTVNNRDRVTLYRALPGEQPIDIFPAEGFRIRNHFAMGATGVVRFSFSIAWSEIPLELYNT